MIHTTSLTSTLHLLLKMPPQPPRLTQNSLKSNPVIRKSLTDSNLDIESRLESSKNDFLKLIEEQTTGLMKTFEDFKKFITSTYDKKIDALSARIEAFEDKLKQSEEKFNLLSGYHDLLEEKVNLMNDFNNNRTKLVINGIPSKINDSNELIMSTISNFVGFENPPKFKAFRTKMNDQNDSLFLNFESEFNKDVFFYNYLKIANNLTIENIFNQPGNNKRIYIQFEMSKRQFVLFKEAMKFKKDRKIKNVKVGPLGLEITLNNGKRSSLSSIKELNDVIIVN